MIADKWVLFREAVQFLHHVEPSARRAAELLLEALCNGSIAARAYAATIYKGESREDIDDYEVPSSCWLSYEYDAWNRSDDAIFLTDESKVAASLIRVDRDALMRLRSTISEGAIGSVEALPQKKKRAGGRPREHNWEAAFFYAGAKIGLAGKGVRPSAKQVRVIEAIREYFVMVERSKPPNDDHIRNRVRPLYDDDGGED